MLRAALWTGDLRSGHDRDARESEAKRSGKSRKWQGALADKHEGTEDTSGVGGHAELAECAQGKRLYAHKPNGGHYYEERERREPIPLQFRAPEEEQKREIDRHCEYTDRQTHCVSPPAIQDLIAGGFRTAARNSPALERIPREEGGNSKSKNEAETDEPQFNRGQFLPG